MELFTKTEKLWIFVSALALLYFNEKDKRRRRDRRIRKLRSVK